MQFSVVKALTAAALATVHFAASASLIDPLEYSGAGGTWLQLSETAGLSLNDFATGAGGWNTKYRFALNSEIDALIGSFGLQLGDTGYQQDGMGVGEFVFSVGGMTEFGPSGTYFEDGNQGAFGRGLGRYVQAELTNGDSPWPLGPDCDAYFSCSRFFAIAEQDVNIRDSRTGLFLIRKEITAPPVDVPEPSSLALLGAGVLLAYHRRKKQK
ncbi:PEP-CTERM sorting domain-containing protein [Massilia sp.]|uniref:PEP-CTERM sorting domain-containing protein n=1 Tax=Massilia sp. TaxID=1882437 RepID=UPI0028997D6F|nr:PEP-CTERM sorting domain-containing protein [Massilia sp.]